MTAPQRLEEIVQSVLGEVEKDEVKKYVISRLGRSGNGFSNFTRHPATLLVLGSLLTGGIGGCLSARWQGAEWGRQQRALAEKARTESQLKLVENTTRAVAGSVTSAEDVLVLFTWDWSEASSAAAIGERTKAWYESSRQWRSDSKVLAARLHAEFRDPRISDCFADVQLYRRHLGNNVTNLIYLLEPHKLSELRKGTPNLSEHPEVQGMRQHSLEIIEATTGEDGVLPELVGLMVRETEERSGGRAPAGVLEGVVWLLRDGRRGEGEDAPLCGERFPSLLGTTP